MAAEARTDAVVVFDLAQWAEPIEGTVPQQFEHRRAVRGVKVSMPVSEFDRLEGLGAVSQPDGADQALSETSDEALTASLPEGDEGDQQLRAATAAQLIAYVTQYPQEQARVNRLEQERKQQRVTVLEATQTLDAEADEVGGA